MTTRTPNVKPFSERYKRMKGASVTPLSAIKGRTVYRVQAVGSKDHHDIPVILEGQTPIVGDCDCDAYHYLRDPEGCVHIQKLRDFLQDNKPMTSTTELTTTAQNGLTPYEDTPYNSAPPMLRYQMPERDTLNQMIVLASAFAKSGMFAAKTQEAALTILMTGGELGLMPAQSMRGIHVINGRPTLSAALKVAVCQVRRDVCKYFRMVSSSDTEATYETWRVGNLSHTTLTFTIEDAKRAKLTGKDVWQSYPAAMLRSRCSSGLVDAVYSDLTLGLLTPEEAESIDPINVTPRYQPTQEQNVIEAALSDEQPVSDTEARELYRNLSKACTLSLKTMLPDVRAEWQAWMTLRYQGRSYKDMTIEDLEDLKGTIDAAVVTAGAFTEPLPPKDPQDGGSGEGVPSNDDNDDPFKDS